MLNSLIQDLYKKQNEDVELTKQLITSYLKYERTRNTPTIF